MSSPSAVLVGSADIVVLPNIKPAKFPREYRPRPEIQVLATYVLAPIRRSLEQSGCQPYRTAKMNGVDDNNYNVFGLTRPAGPATTSPPSLSTLIKDRPEQKRFSSRAQASESPRA